MVATQTKLRRGTNAQVLAMTPAEAEPVVDLTNDRIHIGDGTTAGGVILPRALDLQQLPFNYCVVGGTADLITLTIPLMTAYAAPLYLAFKASLTNTGPTDINVNSIGFKNVYKIQEGSIVELAAGDIVSGGLYFVMYDGVQFQLVNLGAGGITSVSQGDLNTSTGTGSIIIGSTGGTYDIGITRLTANITNLPRLVNLTTGAGVTLPGGSYGFYPLVGRAGSGGANGVTYSQTYITSSPPYDLGDGEVGGFIFVKVDKNGDVMQHYAADVPPWAYNGPTDIRATHKCRVTGKKFRKVLKKRSVQQIMEGAKIEYELQEITHKLKNADMKIIPHPFDDTKDGSRIILLDPMDSRVARLIELQNSGASQEVIEVITGYLSIDNSSITRKCPKGVTPCKFKYRGK